MNKNTNPMNDIINEFTEKFGDNKVQLSFRDVKEGMDGYFGLINMTAELVKLIREEETLRKHHRAYLHVREDILEGCDELMKFIHSELMRHSDHTHFHYIPKDKEDDGYPFAVVDEDDDEDALVVVAKTDYDGLIEDILTLAELVTMITEMRTADLKAIREFGKFVPAFAAFERNRLSVYKDARFEADEIIDRLEEMEEPDEYFSD